MSFDRFGQGPCWTGGNGSVDAVSKWGATGMLHRIQPRESNVDGGVGALGMMGSCGREGQEPIEGLATIYAGHQLGSDASECERLGFEAKAKEWARRVRHGVEQADGHVQQTEQFGLGVVLSGQLTADVGAVSEQREALEVRPYVGSAILERRTV